MRSVGRPNVWRGRFQAEIALLFIFHPPSTLHPYPLLSPQLQTASLAGLSGTQCPRSYRLVGLVVKASASGAKDPGFKSLLRRDFSGSSRASDFKIGTPVATLPGAWRYRLGLVGPVSVHCDWVRWKVCSTTSISV